MCFATVDRCLHVVAVEVYTGVPVFSNMSSPAAAIAATAPKKTTVASHQDESCAVFVRNALFPLRRDYASNNRSHQHHQIHPALMALDRLRSELVEKRETPFSSLFPRRVMLVRDSTSSSMDWNGQPDITGNGAAVEVVPDVLSVQCMECNDFLSKHKDVKAFWRSKERYDSSHESELVVCSDRVLQKDYNKAAANGKTAQTLLDERKDLPPQSMKVVEEVLAHEISKLSVIPKSGDNDNTNSTATQTPSAQSLSCQAFAKLELAAARAAECIYEQKESERRRGSRLGHFGFSWLPQSLQRSQQDRCVQQVAREFTAKEFGKKEAASCVDQALKSSQ